jgi:uncharacterized protein
VLVGAVNLVEEQVRLAKHRLLEVEGKIAILAEGSTGWCVVDKSDYKVIIGEVGSWFRNKSDFDSDSLRALNLLDDAGLLEHVPSVTAKKSIGHSDAAPKTLLLKLTGSCNLACTYCYDYDKVRFKKQIDPERAIELIRHILTSNSESLRVVFHGGEPLLRFDLLQHIVESVNAIDGSQRRIAYSIQTNGSLFNDLIVSFLEQHDFSVGISLDGLGDQANRLRISRDGSSISNKIEQLFVKYPQFMLKRCGFLAVVTKTSISSIPKFALWLQQKGIRTFGFTFMDEEGSAKGLLNELVNASEAVELFQQLVSMIESKQITTLAITPLTSRIANMFTLAPRDYCHKGPCGASSDFMVLDADGGVRTCDCADHQFFRVADNTVKVIDIVPSASLPRRAIVDRHEFLRTSGKNCRACSIFGLCGGTCVAKALITTGSASEVDERECKVAKYFYPLLLSEFAKHGEDASLFEYFFNHNPRVTI